MSVTVRRQPVTLPTYAPQAPDRNPMFLEKRVYQGSSGKVYPLPFIDRIAERPVPREWDAVHLENEYLYVMILPQLGGRIHVARDKTNGYDFVYNQPVIKPALVGLAGPWISGGIEFNWPQHHRPSTFLPADVAIERHAGGAVTVWLSEHDPMERMKGMHGVHLAPGRAVLEVKVRVYNRTTLPRTFLWWANVATRVHERYQSFFPPDATFVADHAKRAMSAFPLCAGRYYGVDYAGRAKRGVPTDEIPPKYIPAHCAERAGMYSHNHPTPAPCHSERSEESTRSLIGEQMEPWILRSAQDDKPSSKRFPDLSDTSGAQFSSEVPSPYAANDLSWYANIPVPTSYMCLGTDEDFFGGYDHAARAGLVHVADHHIAPGKKQWTWGNHHFGYAWDRNLTDADANGEYPPYIELMAGVFTDNQPDFSFLAPGETKTWSQHWYPIREIGPAQHANLAAAVSLRVASGRAQFGVAVTSSHASATICLRRGNRLLYERPADLAPGAAQVGEVLLPRGTRETDLTLTVYAAGRRELISYRPKPRRREAVPAPATEPAAPRNIATADELFLTGLHLEQYRHATRDPADYWREGLRRDRGDARCHHALGRWHLRRGEWTEAEDHFRRAIARLTHRNPNPADGEPHYHLGVCLRLQADAASGLRGATRNALLGEAYDAFYKSAWNAAQQPAAYHALAEIDCVRGDWPRALAHLDAALRLNTDNLRARNLKVLVLRRLDRPVEAAELLTATLALDPLDWWARQLAQDGAAAPTACDPQVWLDLAHDCARAGFFREALDLLTAAQPGPTCGTAPLVAYTAAWLCHLIGDAAEERRHLANAAKASPDYCFPARLEEIAVLRHAMAANSRDARAPYYLGNLLYDRRRHGEAIALWEKSARLDPKFSIVWRNLGIGCFNLLRKPARARAAYDRAVAAAPRDARLCFERDQLWKRLGEAPAVRLAELEACRDLVVQRDDLTIEYCSLLNHVGRHAEALTLISKRKFQPWEGGEGLALGQHVRTHLALGRTALAVGDAATARRHFEAALGAPENLGEARHLLANQSDVHFWLGCALAAAGERESAREQWRRAATFRGDFQSMSVRTFSEMTDFSARALAQLGRRAAARKLWRGLLAYARRLARTPAKIDYFATSLPTMLLFEDNLARRQRLTAFVLEAQARRGLGDVATARHLVSRVLRSDPAHAVAADLRAELSALARVPSA